MLLFLLSIAFAISPKNPQTMCDRFISDDSQKSCQERIKKIGPDWYLSTVCEKQFDDGEFFTCLELSNKYNFSPVKLEQCADDNYSDEQRKVCLLNIAVNEKQVGAFQSATQTKPQRIPTSKMKP